MTIDELGFITPIETNKLNSVNYFANSQIYYKMEDSRVDRSENFNQTQRTNINNNVKKIRSKNNCWICEGWKEHHFSIKRDLHKFLSGEEEEVCIHFSFEGYKPVEIKKNEDSGDFEIYRMCPPGESNYYYTINKEYATNNRRGAGSVIPNFSTLMNFMKEKGDDISDPSETGGFKGFGSNSTTNLNNANSTFNTAARRATMATFNKTTITVSDGSNLDIPNKAICKYFHDYNKNVINEDYFSQVQYCRPRPSDDLDIHIRPVTPWSFPSSIWSSIDYNHL